MKRWKKFNLGALSIVSVATPIAAVVSCGSVNGEFTYKIVGLNEHKTDYVIKFDTNKQYIAKVLEDTLGDQNKFSIQLKEKILNDIKDLYPKEYLNGELKHIPPSVSRDKLTSFKIYFPIKISLGNVPSMSDVLKSLAKGDPKAKLLEDTQKKIEDKIFFDQNLFTKHKDPKALDEAILKKYDDKNTSPVEDKDVVNFNYLGILPYMSGELDNDTFEKLKSLGFAPTEADEKAFLEAKFNNKKHREQIVENITLSNTFEVKELRGKQMKIFFFISDIEKRNPNYVANSAVLSEKEEYIKLEDDKVKYDKTKHRAKVFYSLFIEQKITPMNNNSTTVEVNGKEKIEDSFTNQIFTGFKVGDNLSKSIFVDPKKNLAAKLSFDDNGKKVDNELARYFVGAGLGILSEKKDANDNPIKDMNGEVLYKLDTPEKVKATFNFKIEKVYRKNNDGNYVARKIGELIQDGDKVVYSNSEVIFYGLPFDKGEASNHSMYIDTEGSASKFITGFDKLMVEKQLSTTTGGFITPIFPDPYQEKSLSNKLVKFMIKINKVYKRKTVDLKFFRTNNISIKTMQDYSLFIIQDAKNKLYNTFTKEHLNIMEIHLPFYLIEKKYRQAVQTLWQNNLRQGKKQQPTKDQILAQAQKLAEDEFRFTEFVKMNKIGGSTKKEQYENVLNELFNNL